ncbi:MAG: nucleotidyltransferase domain-containing protein [Methylobacteriaceae bacterium]|nr:nucleotidyltransferase domain-containing protein [Methylobacteriaceae bacterium]
MTAAEVVAQLRAHRPALEAAGVRHAALFGSLARGEAGAASDIDILIDIAPMPRFSVYDYAAIRETAAALFDAPVDVVARRYLRPEIAARAEADAVRAF